MWIFLLPSVSMERLQVLPPAPGIYYVTAAWSVFYVGKSKNLQRRWGSHHRFSDFLALHPFGRIHYRLLPIDRISDWERREIHRLRPPWNGRSCLTPWGRWGLSLLIGIWVAVLLAAFTLALGGVIYIVLTLA